VPGENDPQLSRVAVGANESMVLEAWHGVGDDFHQDQLSAARRTTHRSTPIGALMPHRRLSDSIDDFGGILTVTCYVVDDALSDRRRDLSCFLPHSKFINHTSH
jgi:hypothetical protein